MNQSQQLYVQITQPCRAGSVSLAWWRYSSSHSINAMTQCQSSTSEGNIWGYICNPVPREGKEMLCQVVTPRLHLCVFFRQSKSHDTHKTVHNLL